jgi:hypothetical protein
VTGPTGDLIRKRLKAEVLEEGLLGKAKQNPNEERIESGA